MKNLIDDIRKNTPKYMPGYNCIKTQNVYTPFMKITIECLTKKISELNLFFESILKLVEISVKDIDEIAEILGVSTGVINEAIVDMVNIDYLFVSEGVLTITKKGVKALETRKKVDIHKTYLRDLIVDMITGAIYDADSMKLSKIESRNVILEGTINIDSNFLDTHFQEINLLYQMQQKKNSVFGNSAITNELYKTIGVAYSELHYYENKVYIYKSDTSDELMYVFANDSNDKYKNEFYAQLKDSYRPCQEYFFEKDRNFINEIKKQKTEIDDLKLSQSQTITKLLFSDKVDNDALINAFAKDRYGLNDREYLSYLYYNKAFRYKKIYICSNNLGRLLSNAFCSQISILADTIPIFIIYNKNEYGIEKSLQHYFKDVKEKLNLIPKDIVYDNMICFDSQLIMYLQEHIVTAFDRPMAYLQLACTFNPKVVSDEICKIINNYGLELLNVGERVSNKLNKAKTRKRSR